jgi:hypothetical protein
MVSAEDANAAPAARDARDAPNELAYRRMVDADPVLVDVLPAREVVPGFDPNIVLTSGPPHSFDEYTNGQRDAVVYGALYEGLAGDYDEAVEGFRSGAIHVKACQDLGCIGSLAGIYTASMPVFVVEDRSGGTRAFCNLYEGENPRRLNYACWGEDVRQNLLFLQDVMGPVLGEAVRAAGGIPLKPIIRRALHMSDELHSRNTAATVLFTRAITPALVDVAGRRRDDVLRVLDFLSEADYFFLRLSMAAGKAAGDAAHGIPGSSVVTSMTISCLGAAIRVSGLGDRWFEGPHCKLEGKLFEGHTEDDIVWMGGESLINETVGLGGFAQAAAFPLQAYQGGTPEAMIEHNLEMYEITVGEHTDYRIPFFSYRGTPVGIDVFKVVETGITPCADIGVAGAGGGQIGAGIGRLPMEVFVEAANAHAERYAETIAPS